MITLAIGCGNIPGKAEQKQSKAKVRLHSCSSQPIRRSGVGISEAACGHDLRLWMQSWIKQTKNKPKLDSFPFIATMWSYLTQLSNKSSLIFNAWNQKTKNQTKRVFLSSSSEAKRQLTHRQFFATLTISVSVKLVKVRSSAGLRRSLPIHLSRCRCLFVPRGVFLKRGRNKFSVGLFCSSSHPSDPDKTSLRVCSWSFQSKWKQVHFNLNIFRYSREKTK